MEIYQNNYLTWQKAQIDVEVSPPVPVSHAIPQWWKSLPGNLDNVTQGCPNRNTLENHGLRSAKFCLGLRGARSIGYTIPLDIDIQSDRITDVLFDWNIFYNNVKDKNWPLCDNEENFDLLPTHIKQECIDHHGYTPLSQRPKYPSPSTSFLHPEMLHGTHWTDKNDTDYKWSMILSTWPWRAKLSKGWRLLIIPNQFDWSPDYHVFTGCVDANYRINGNNVGSNWNFEESIDPDYNYFNIELVVAIKQGSIIPKSRCIFSAIPVYEPDYKSSMTYRMPNFSKY